MNNGLMDIFVINWSGKKYIGACLRSLSRLDYSPFKVTLVDPKNEIELSSVKKEYPSIALASLPMGTPHTKVLNTALELAGDETSYIAFIDSAIAVDPGWARALIRAADEDSHAGVFVSKLLFKIAPGIIYNFGIALGEYGRIWECLQGTVDSVSLPVRHPSSPYLGAALFRKDVMNELGGFDQGLDPHYGMIDYCLRAIRAGYSSVSVPDARAYTSNPTSIRENILKSSYLVNQAKIMLLHYPPGKAISGMATLLATILFDRKGKGIWGSDLPDRLCRPRALAGILSAIPTLVFRRTFRSLSRSRRAQRSRICVSILAPRLEKYYPSPACDRVFPARILMGVSDFFLGKGWEKIRRDYISGYPATCYRCMSNKSIAYLTIPKGVRHVLQLCLSNPSPSASVLKIFVNRKYQGEITVEGRKWKTYQLALAVPQGLSEIEFETNNVHRKEIDGDFSGTLLKVSEIGIYPENSPFIRENLPSLTE